MRRFLAVVAVGVAFVATSAPVRAETAETTLAPSSETVLTTHFYEIRSRVFSLPAATPWVTSLRDSVVLVLGADSDLGSSPLLGGANTAYPVFSFDAARSSVKSLGTLDLRPVVGPEARVRILDFQYIPRLQRGDAGRASVLVSLATYSAATGCRTLIVQEALVDLTGASQNGLGKRWFTLPCITPYTPNEGTWLFGPGLHQSGGRVALVPASQWASARQPEIYLTVGDFAVLANLGDQLPRSTRRLLSTVLRITSTGRTSVVATGIRNAQGMAAVALDRKPALVATTHGPRGGDGLLDVRPGDDYGWPRESYGTVYDYAPTPVQSKPQVDGRLPTATKPAFSWLPSIGPSAVLQVTGPAFGAWWGSRVGRPTGDLLVSGMASQQLYRVRWDEGAVRYVEPMNVGLRVRSMTQDPNGAIILGVDTAGPNAGGLVVLDPLRGWNSATSSLS